MCEAAKFKAVRTYIASGNVVFESALPESAMKQQLQRRLLAYAGKPVGVMVRTAKEMAEVLARNPFPNAPANRTMAIFLDAAPPPDALESVSGAVDRGGRSWAAERSTCSTARRWRAAKLKIPAAKNGTAPEHEYGCEAGGDCRGEELSQRRHVDYEAVAHVAPEHPLIRFVDRRNVDHFDVGRDAVLGAVVQHLLCFAECRRCCDPTRLRRQFSRMSPSRFEPAFEARRRRIITPSVSSRSRYLL